MFKVGDRVKYKDYAMTGTITHITKYSTSVEWDDGIITSIFDSEIELLPNQRIPDIGHDSKMALELADRGE